MANPNKSPQKGFIKEIATATKLTRDKQNFSYDKPVVGASSNAMNTPRRLSTYKATRAPESNLVHETAQHIKTRRTK